ARCAVAHQVELAEMHRCPPRGRPLPCVGAHSNACAARLEQRQSRPRRLPPHALAPMAFAGAEVGRLTPSGRHQAPLAGAGPARVGPSAKRPPATQCGPSARIEDTTAKSSAAVKTPPMIIIFIFCSLR